MNLSSQVYPEAASSPASDSGNGVGPPPMPSMANEKSKTKLPPLPTTSKYEVDSEAATEKTPSAEAEGHPVTLTAGNPEGTPAKRGWGGAKNLAAISGLAKFKKASTKVRAMNRLKGAVDLSVFEKLSHDLNHRGDMSEDLGMVTAPPPPLHVVSLSDTNTIGMFKHASGQ